MAIAITFSHLVLVGVLALAALPSWAEQREKGANLDTRWQPAPNARFDWQLTEPFELNRATDVLDLDLYDAKSEDLRTLKNRGVRLVCYINVGAWEDWRAYAQNFPTHVFGQAYQGWPGERWLDIRDIEALAPILTARFDLCRDRGFDAVEPDNIDGYENTTGFSLSRADQVHFNLWLAQLAHERGLSIALKNTADLLPELVGVYDWALTEDCFAQDWCGSMAPVVEAGKAVFAVEYTDQPLDWTATCAKAKALGIRAILKSRNLDGWLMRCE